MYLIEILDLYLLNLMLPSQNQVIYLNVYLNNITLYTVPTSYQNPAIIQNTFSGCFLYREYKQYYQLYEFIWKRFRRKGRHYIKIKCQSTLTVALLHFKYPTFSACIFIFSIHWVCFLRKERIYLPSKSNSLPWLNTDSRIQLHIVIELLINIPYSVIKVLILLLFKTVFMLKLFSRNIF